VFPRLNVDDLEALGCNVCESGTRGTLPGFLIVDGVACCSEYRPIVEFLGIVPYGLAIPVDVDEPLGNLDIS
jgi:hypothetical protein